MKLTITFILLFVAGRLCAQKVTGMLMGEVTRMPLAHATITAGSNTVLTNAYGMFTINVLKPGDSIRISCAGYAYHAFKPVNTNQRDTLIIYLQPMAYALKEVVITSSRNFKADSLRTRKDFAKVFTYKTPKVTDAMVKINPYKDIPDDHITARNSTASIVGFDVLRLVNFLSKKKNTTSHLQKTLLKAEIANYVDHAFSQQKVMAITALKGDSLQTFMYKYRPTASQVDKMTEYDMVNYIRKCYEGFVKK